MSVRTVTQRFVYRDDDDFHFIDTQSYEQSRVARAKG